MANLKCYLQRNVVQYQLVSKDYSITSTLIGGVRVIINIILNQSCTFQNLNLY